VRVAGEMIEEGIEVANCAYCRERFYRGRASHRFCSARCHYEFFQAERRAALAWYRATVVRRKGREEQMNGNGHTKQNGHTEQMNVGGEGMNGDHEKLDVVALLALATKPVKPINRRRITQRESER
jgi:hypothetical protein